MAGVTTEAVTAGFVAGFRAAGIPFAAKNIDATDSGPNKMFMIRLSKSGTVLPGLGFIESQIKLDRVPPGSVAGAYYCVVGLVQQSGGMARITGRIVRVETGVVEHAAKADGPATAQGLARAATQVVTGLWERFRQSS